MNIGIIANSNKEGAAHTLNNLIAEIEKRDFQYLLEEQTAQIISKQGIPACHLAQKSDIVAVLGGDGTMLNAAYRIDCTETPIAGINIGTLGFLTSCRDDELSLFLDAIIAKNYRIVPRTLLQATVTHADGTTEVHNALNEITLNRGITGRLVELEALIDGDLLNHYRADGLIVATPTGSTAYSMAAGGPLISPLANVYVITPICPHSLTDRSLVITDTCEVQLKSIDRDGEPTIFTVDGRVIIEVEYGSTITIKKSPHTVNLIRLEDRSFFSTLRQKLDWG